MVASAYWDNETINALINNVNDRRLKGFATRVEIYLNGTKTIDRYKELKKLDAKIQEIFQHGDSGIYVLRRGFMHVKAYQIEGRHDGTLILGSANLTKPGLTSNEESLIQIGYKIRSKPNYVKQFEKYIWGHFEEEVHSPTMVHISDFTIGKKDQNISNAREFFNSGSLWYESKAPDPLRIKLDLPNELFNSQLPPRMRRFIDADITDSISIKQLIRETIPESSADLDNESVETNRSSWKQWSVETTLGRFVPLQFEDRVKYEIAKFENRVSTYTNIEGLITENEGTLQRAFLELIEEVAEQVFNIGYRGDNSKNLRWSMPDGRRSKDVSFFKNDKREVFRKIWKRDIRKILRKLNSTEFVEKLAVSVRSCEVPDIWEQEEVRDPFLSSFIESINYAIDMKSKNRFAGVAKNFLETNKFEFANFEYFEKKCFVKGSDFTNDLAKIAKI